jgi:ferrochelatase
MSAPERLVGVLLMSYGSPESLDDVSRYLTAVRGGRPPDPEVTREFRRRYELIGGSPLIARTIEQAAALQALLAGRATVRAAMRFSAPGIREAVAALAREGIGDVLGIILSPQFSPLLMGGYLRDLEAAARDTGASRLRVRVAGPWHRRPAFLAALADRVREALAGLSPDEVDVAPVLFTVHSLPRRVAEEEPAYLAQLMETAAAVAGRAGLAPERWDLCWQSAGHEPGEWMRPDFADLIPILARRGHRSVVVAPVQFVADHLEILYDIDVAARGQAEAHGLTFVRIASLNAAPGLIEALAGVVRDEMGP